MPTEIHDSQKDIHKCIDYIDKLINDDSFCVTEYESYYLALSKSYLEEHARCIDIDRWHAQTVREKVDD